MWRKVRTTAYWSLPIICIIAFFSNQQKITQKQQNEAQEILQSLSAGNVPINYGGSIGQAITELRDKHTNTPGQLRFDVRQGDAPPPIGDGSCDFHALCYLAEESEAFAGVRLKLRNKKWHIAGYWTP